MENRSIRMNLDPTETQYYSSVEGKCRQMFKKVNTKTMLFLLFILFFHLMCFFPFYSTPLHWYSPPMHDILILQKKNLFFVLFFTSHPGKTFEALSPSNKKKSNWSGLSIFQSYTQNGLPRMLLQSRNNNLVDFKKRCQESSSSPEKVVAPLTCSLGFKWGVGSYFFGSGCV